MDSAAEKPAAGVGARNPWSSVLAEDELPIAVAAPAEATTKAYVQSDRIASLPEKAPDTRRGRKTTDAALASERCVSILSNDRSVPAMLYQVDSQSPREVNSE
jgi:hypothetical protein